jgi:protein gp37
MAEHSHIEWTDATWNPITGCSVISPGCTNCYAMNLAGTRLRHHPSRKGLTQASKAGPVWNGQVRLNEQWLFQPSRWGRPRRIFVCAHGDLFHEGVPDAWIDKVFAIMWLNCRHTFQVLTKRAGRMGEYLSEPTRAQRIAAALKDLTAAGGDIQLPLPNVWLGVSAEDQPRANERIPYLLATPAALRFVSLEPLLGPIDALPYLFIFTHEDDALLEAAEDGETPVRPWRDPATTHPDAIITPRLDWVIVGGESGPGARPMHPDWARKIRDDCAATEVPFFFKQHGEFAPGRAQNVTEASGNGEPFIAWPDGAIAHGTAAEHGGPGGHLLRVGKKAAGRLLDGAEHNAMPGLGA